MNSKAMAACSQGHNGVTEHTDLVTPGSTTTDMKPYTNYSRRPSRHQHLLFTCLRIRGLAVRLVRAHQRMCLLTGARHPQQGFRQLLLCACANQWRHRGQRAALPLFGCSRSCQLFALELCVHLRLRTSQRSIVATHHR